LYDPRRVAELPSILLVLLAAGAAGVLGALLGLGGGVFLIPLLNGVLGVPHGSAAVLSLFTVIGTSSAVTVSSSGRARLNTRLGLVLAAAAVLGAIAGNRQLDNLTEFWFQRIFGTTAVLGAAVILARSGRRNVLMGDNIDVGPLGGRFHEYESGGEVAYRVKRMPLAVSGAFGAGMLSTLIGVGGGIVVVPILNSWCGVPLRAAAATSSFLIGITAVPGIAGHYQLGHLTLPALAAASVLGVFAGTRGGLWVSTHAPVRVMKLILAAVLGSVGAWYLIFK
jgi:uncharacterized membrane protein YfcA